MPNTIYVNLAMPSPLYAPIYLAKTLLTDRIFRNVEFVYAERLSDSREVDRLTHRLLTLGSRRNCLVSVGDPLRFANIRGHNYDQPYLIGALLQRMCFWIIDGDTEYKEADRFESHFRNIISPPRHMTGHRLLRYELKELLHTDDAIIDRLIYPAPEPGAERRYYTSFSKKIKKNGKSFAYLTANPIEAVDADGRQHVKRHYFLDNHFSECLMTGLITGRDLYLKRGEEINDLIGGIQKALNFMRRTPGDAARSLKRYADEAVDFRSVNLEQCFEHLGEYDAYYTVIARNSISDEVLRKHLHKALQIHSCSSDHEVPLSSQIQQMCGLDGDVGAVTPSMSFVASSPIPLGQEINHINEENWFWFIRFVGLVFSFFSIRKLVDELIVPPESWWSALRSAQQIDDIGMGAVDVLLFSVIGALTVIPDMRSLYASEGRRDWLGVVSSTLVASSILFAIARTIVSYDEAMATGFGMLLALTLKMLERIVDEGFYRQFRRLIRGWKNEVKLRLKLWRAEPPEG